MAIFSTPAPDSADGPKPPFNRRKGDGIPLSIVARDMEIQGTINATERVELQATALVRGDIATPRIAILEGGKVTGEVNMTEPAPGEPKKSLEVSSGS